MAWALKATNYGHGYGLTQPEDTNVLAVLGEARFHPQLGYSIQPARDRRMAWVQVVCSS